MLLLTLFFVCKKIFTNKVGFFAVLILSFQSIFLSQFALVLPEILVVLFSVLAVYFYIRKIDWAYLLFGSLLVLTKESGVIVILSIVIWNVIDYLKSTKKENFNSYKFLKINFFLSLPIVCLLIHFLLLKYYFGWFFFPEHISEFNFNWEDFSWRIRKTLNYIFVDNGRQPILIALISIAILFNQKISIKYRLFILLLFFSLTKIFFRYWKTFDIIEIYIVPIVFIFVIRYIFWEEKQMNKFQQKFIGFSLIFSILYSLFSSSYFDNLRYLFYILPFFIIVSCYYVSTLTYFKNISIIIFTFICIGFSMFFTFQDKDYGDVNLSYGDVAIMYSRTIDYLEEREFYDYPIKTPFLFKHALTRPLSSYLKSKRIFTNFLDNKNMDNCTQCLFLFTNVESKSPIYEEVKNNSNYELIQSFQVGDAWSEIYQKK